MSENKVFTVSASPHVKSPVTATGIMLDVIIALIPAAIASATLFGYRAVLIMVLCIGSCMLFEFVSRKILKRTFSLGDLSAVVTGLLLAFNLPVSIMEHGKWWMPIIGSFFAIVVAKQLFGGIGQNFANPAIVGRIVMLISFPSAMSAFTNTRITPDALTSATPLASLNAIDLKGDIDVQLLENANNLPGLQQMLFGIRQGCIGEVCIAALLLGGLWLIVRGVIKPVIPLCYIGTVAVFMLAVSSGNLRFTAYELMSGGLVLGAFFMATDYTTSPVTKWGKVIFGIGCGIITCVIRLYGSMNEGVSYAILLMNIASPLIEKITSPRPFGVEKNKKEKKAKEEISA